MPGDEFDESKAVVPVKKETTLIHDTLVRLLTLRKELLTLQREARNNVGLSMATERLKKLCNSLETLKSDVDFDNALKKEVNDVIAEADYEIESAKARADIDKLQARGAGKRVLGAQDVPKPKAPVEVADKYHKLKQALKGYTPVYADEEPINKPKIEKDKSEQINRTLQNNYIRSFKYGTEYLQVNAEYLLALKAKLGSYPEYNVSVELEALGTVIDALSNSTKTDRDQPLVERVRQAVIQAENHVRYVDYIKNIERTVEDMQSHVDIIPKPETTIQDEIDKLKTDLNSFKSRPLNTVKNLGGNVIEKGKMESVVDFQNNMVEGLNKLNDQMRGSEYRKVLKPLIKHALLAVLLPPTVLAVAASLIHRAATGKFLFFESKQKQVNNIYKSVKNAPPVPGEPEPPKMK